MIPIAWMSWHRNPRDALCDLIKCHALLHLSRRDRDEEGSIIANRADFIYARMLFLSISGDSGGRVTKQTRNEAAAFDTICALGVEIFTIRQLQNVQGLSPIFSPNRTYWRSPVSLGRCTLCNNGPAVYHPDTQRAGICEKWYARLVREANKEEGVR